MLTTLFLTTVMSNVLVTGIIIIALFLLFWLEMLFMRKHEQSLKKILIILIYLFSFFALITATSFLLELWGIEAYKYILASFTSLIGGIEQSITQIFSSLVVIFTSIFILKISRVTLNRIASKKGPNQKRKVTITKIARSVFKYSVSIATILIILSLWGIDIAPALAGLGILGLVIGLGAQKFINDLINGFFIIFEDHFSVGDRIEVQGFKGDVVDIGLKTTKLTNWKGDLKILSNGEITSLINYSRNYSIAIVEFGIAYKENVDKATALLNQELKEMRTSYPEIIEDPVVIGVISLADSSVNMRVIAKTECEQHYAVEREMRARVKQILDDNNIEIPFPQVVIHNS